MTYEHLTDEELAAKEAELSHDISIVMDVIGRWSDAISMKGRKLHTAFTAQKSILDRELTRVLIERQHRESEE